MTCQLTDQMLKCVRDCDDV